MMKVPTISDYLYQLHHFKLELLMEMRKKRALQVAYAIALLVMVGVLIWIFK